MDDFTATMIAEGAQEAPDRETLIEAWQHLIDTGLCWRLQGWFGRTAAALIESGECSPPQAYVSPDDDPAQAGRMAADRAQEDHA